MGWDAGRGHPREPGLLTILDVRLRYYALGGEEYHRAAVVYTVFTSNTSVFTYTTPLGRDSVRWEAVKPEDWSNTSNHDSCWRSDGLRHLTELYFTLSEEMNGEIEADNLPKVAPQEFHPFVSLGALGMQPWYSVMVEHEQEPTTPHQAYGYKRRIVAIEKAPKD
jgi:hypothetical protein